MDKPAKNRNSASERIRATAASLFYNQGIRATGVDKIIEDSGVAKMTFYKHFKTKETLIAEYLQARDQQWWKWVETALKQYKADDSEKPLVIFDALEQRLQRPFRRGCAFVNAMAELADPNHAGYQVALLHKRKVEAFVSNTCTAVGYLAPEELARELVLLLEGALVTAQRDGITRAAKTAREMARKVLRLSSRHHPEIPKISKAKTPAIS
jgi:AcrR family transcriptional regulator